MPVLHFGQGAVAFSAAGWRIGCILAPECVVRVNNRYYGAGATRHFLARSYLCGMAEIRTVTRLCRKREEGCQGAAASNQSHVYPGRFPFLFFRLQLNDRLAREIHCVCKLSSSV